MLGTRAQLTFQQPINGLLGLTHLLPTAAADERDELLVQLRTVGDGALATLLSCQK